MELITPMHFFFSARVMQQISARVLFETTFRGILVGTDEKYWNWIESTWVKRHQKLTQHVLKEKERFKDLVSQSAEGELLIKAKKDKIFLKQPGIKELDAEEMVSEVSRVLGETIYLLYYTEIIQLQSIYVHPPISLMKRYYSIDDFKKVRTFKAGSAASRYYPLDIIVGIVSNYLKYMNTLFSWKIENRLKLIDSLIRE